MDIFLRVVAIIVEVAILSAITYAILNAIRLTVFDLGVGPKYGKAISLLLVLAGLALVVFFIAHLTTFYPKV
jgi:succinate dehydrogenase/fumarate reductase cytochrome b subunit